jgi:hypothetical protein
VEYNRSNGASFHGAISAYEKGATGKGVKVGVVDSGINPTLAEFAGRIDPASQDVAASRGITDTEGHGTAVAGVIAASRNGVGAHGVAFNSTIISLNTSNPKDCDEEDGCQHSSVDIARAIDLARINGARVINISLGGGDSSFSVNSAIARAAQAGIVVVMSAGNNGKEATGANPELFGLSASQYGNVILAGAVDSTRTITDFSNRAGTGASRYLTALGYRVRTIDEAGTATLWSGTSFSAPVISGAAALLVSAFPHLTATQVIEILFKSADDLGAAGVDSIYGRGYLNIARAFEPQGQITVAGTSAAATSTGGSGSGATGDAAPGLSGVVVLDGFSRAYVMNLASALQRAEPEQPLADALQPGLRSATTGSRNLAVSVTVQQRINGQPEVGFAQLGLTYEDARKARIVSGMAVSRLGRNTAVALGFSESGKTLEQRLSGHHRNAFLVARDPISRMGFQADAASSVGLRHKIGPAGLTVTSERGEVQQPGFDRSIVQPGYSIGSLTLDRRVGPARLSFGASRLEEESTLLGARFSEMLGVAGATSWFADGSASVDLGRGWGAYAAYRRGWTSTSGLGALAQGGRLTTDAWAVDISRLNALRPGDKFALRLMQPLRVRSGGLDLNVPVSFDYGTMTPGYERRLFNLAPTGREIDLEAAYGMDMLGGAAHLSGNAFIRRQPGHVTAMNDDLGAAVRFTLGF